MYASTFLTTWCHTQQLTQQHPPPPFFHQQETRAAINRVLLHRRRSSSVMRTMDLFTHTDKSQLKDLQDLIDYGVEINATVGDLKRVAPVATMCVLSQLGEHDHLTPLLAALKTTALDAALVLLQNGIKAVVVLCS